MIRVSAIYPSTILPPPVMPALRLTSRRAHRINLACAKAGIHPDCHLYTRVGIGPSLRWGDRLYDRALSVSPVGEKWIYITYLVKSG